MTEAGPKKKFTLPREIRLILSLGSLIFVFEYLVLPQLGAARHSLPLLGSVNPWLVTFAVLLEIAAILCYVELTRTVLYPYAPSRYNTLRVDMAGFAISHVVPGGTAPAGALAYRIFNDLGVPKETNAFGLAAQGSGSAVVLNVIFWIALVISIPLNGFNPLYGFAVLAKVAGRITLLISNRRTLWWAFAWATLNWLLDAFCLWVFLWSFGSVVSPIDLLVAYGLAN